MDTALLLTAAGVAIAAVTLLVGPIRHMVAVRRNRPVLDLRLGEMGHLDDVSSDHCPRLRLEVSNEKGRVAADDVELVVWDLEIPPRVAAYRPIRPDTSVRSVRLPLRWAESSVSSATNTIPPGSARSVEFLFIEPPAHKNGLPTVVVDVVPSSSRVTEELAGPFPSGEAIERIPGLKGLEQAPALIRLALRSRNATEQRYTVAFNYDGFWPFDIFLPGRMESHIQADILTGHAARSASPFRDSPRLEDADSSRGGLSLPPQYSAEPRDSSGDTRTLAKKLFALRPRGNQKANRADRLCRKVRRVRHAPLSIWRAIRGDALLTAIVASLVGYVAIEWGGDAISLVRSVSPAPSVHLIEEIRERDMWTDEPELFAGATQILDDPRRLSVNGSKFDPYPQVRTAQEFAEDAFSLAGNPVIIVGRVAAIESRGPGHPELGRDEIALFGQDGESRAVVIGGMSVGRPPPFLVPEGPGRLVPLPGSPQRFRPDFEYGVFLGMVAAVGDTISPAGGRVRTAYALASDGVLATSKHGLPQLGAAVQQALNDLPSGK